MSYYDDIASGYDELHKDEQLRKLQIMIGRLRNEELQPGPILDVGCGTGFSLDILAKELGKTVIGIEPSQGMIDHYTGSQTITLADAETMQFEDEHFSAIISITAIQNFSDIALGVAQMRTVARQEAPVLVSCLKKSSKLKEVSEALAEAFTVEELIEEDKDIIFCCRKSARLK